jgi:glycosyltransferase involved in cell wall biosynthesis
MLYCSIARKPQNYPIENGCMRNHNQPDISIVTPSNNNIGALKLNLASVRDQQGVDIEHIIIDNGSSDGTVDWLQSNAGILVKSKPYKTIYDALNKGFSLASAEIVGQLNSNEQYLPETLKAVKDFFQKHPDIDFLVADYLYTNRSGDLLGYQKRVKPKWIYLFSDRHHEVICTTFYRKKVFEQCTFDLSYQSITDRLFLYDVVKKGFKGKHLRKYFTAVTLSGNINEEAKDASFELSRVDCELPFWYKKLKPIFYYCASIERWLKGAHKTDRAFSYAVYVEDDLMKRSQKEFSREKAGKNSAKLN